MVLGLVFNANILKRVVHEACGVRATCLAFYTRKQRAMPAISNVQPLAFPTACRSSLEKEEPPPFVAFLLFTAHSQPFPIRWGILLQLTHMLLILHCLSAFSVCNSWLPGWHWCHCSTEKQRSFWQSMTHLIICICCIGGIWRSEKKKQFYKDTPTPADSRLKSPQWLTALNIYLTQDPLKGHTMSALLILYFV